MRGNIADLGLPGAELRVGAVGVVLAQSASAAFDLVFADPPYDVPTEGVMADLTALAGNGWLAPEALVIVERSIRSPEIAWPAGYAPLKPRKYGETRIELAEFGASV
ncbi:RsmD family RNA methyltransferase [Nocardia cyriacigeorgica]|uniref:RsmD family RNA methyltransferase n=1 Tax=Nocardia cyriacigeorgica TaxID=135487 RepID=UPI002458E54A|nr:RsmD family RNA methyltransferase [Nocardia cyriacigeorgica]